MYSSSEEESELEQEQPIQQPQGQLIIDVADPGLKINIAETKLTQFSARIEVKAIARRMKPEKVLVATIKNGLIVATTVIPAIWDGVGTPATCTVGYVLYWANQWFEYVNNREARELIKKHKKDIIYLIQDYFEVEKDAVATVFAPSWSVSREGYRLFNPLNPKNKPLKNRVLSKQVDKWHKDHMFGFSPFAARNLSTYILLIQTLLASVTYAFAMASIFSHDHCECIMECNQCIPQEHGATWDVFSIISLIAGVITVLLVPYTQHVTKANLGRVGNTYQDIIFTLQDKRRRRELLEENFDIAADHELGLFKKSKDFVHSIGNSVVGFFKRKEDSRVFLLEDKENLAPNTIGVLEQDNHLELYWKQNQNSPAIYRNGEVKNKLHDMEKATFLEDKSLIKKINRFKQQAEHAINQPKIPSCQYQFFRAAVRLIRDDYQVPVEETKPILDCSGPIVEIVYKS